MSSDFAFKNTSPRLFGFSEAPSGALADDPAPPDPVSDVVAFQ
jgi:hypothetical protein